MTDDIERQLEQRALRGDPRGAEDVWHGASKRAGTATSRRGRPVVLGAVATVLAVAGLLGGLAIMSDRSPERPTATTGSTTTAPEVVIAQNDSSLVLFDDCSEVLDELKAEALERVGPYGLGEGRSFDFAPNANRVISGNPTSIDVSLAPSRSSTNTQEEGIDEADLVETDGRRLFDVHGGTLRVLDVQSAELLATVALGLVNVDGAVLVGDVLAVFASEPLSTESGGEAKVVLVDVSAAPVIGERMSIDGSIVDVRVVDERVHVVTVSSPSIPFTYPARPDGADEGAATDANKDRIRSSALSDWLPSRTISSADGSVVDERAPLTDCQEIRRPRDFAGFHQTSVVTLDLEDLERSTSTSVQASSAFVYSSGDNLYTATTSYNDLAAWDGTTPVMASMSTDLHRFSLGSTPTYLGSGRVDGHVRGQFGVSEHEGHLRVASSTFDGASDSRVTVLRLADGELVETGVVGGLGPNETIEGVRFVGDMGYVVTFLRTDPLYVIDLRDPVAPRLAGELEIPGYSRYLHEVGDGLVLGVGQDGTDDGQLTGAAVSLFDVRDPAAPKRIGLEALGAETAAAVEIDHHAFLWWPESETAYLPVSTFPNGTRVEVVRLEDGLLVHAGEVVPSGNGAPAHASFDRVVVVGGRLLSVSSKGVQVSDASTLEPIAWVPYG